MSSESHIVMPNFISISIINRFDRVAHHPIGLARRPAPAPSQSTVILRLLGSSSGTPAAFRSPSLPTVTSRSEHKCARPFDGSSHKSRVNGNIDWKSENHLNGKTISLYGVCSMRRDTKGERERDTGRKRELEREMKKNEQKRKCIACYGNSDEIN